MKLHVDRELKNKKKTALISHSYEKSSAKVVKVTRI